MKEEGDVFKKFRDSFSRMEGHFHILEQRVPVELQMEYFKYSENVRKENRPPRPGRSLHFSQMLPVTTGHHTALLAFVDALGYRRMSARPCTTLC